MLAHTALHRAEQVARHWTAAGCPVVIHLDKSVPRAEHDAFVQRLSDNDLIRFCRRHRCEWGTWGIVAASQAASEMMLAEFPDIRHVYLASGACLPLRQVEELIDYLAARPNTDFIESATIAEVPWTVGGLDRERFTLRFPFAWKRYRFFFDRYVNLQRRLRVRRRMPSGLVPHMGSQWWCLTRKTLSAILEDPERRRHDRFFRRVWIPDESYYQTLARKHSQNIESRSLTLSKFDFQGKPHVFYDDHLQLLRRSDCFVARKIWPHADRLYEVFLQRAGSSLRATEPNPGKIDRVFSRAVERRTRGRPGLYMSSRFPAAKAEQGITAHPYSVFQGFNEVFPGFENWLAKKTHGTRVHGHLFAPEKAEFEADQNEVNGALCNSAAKRDYDPLAFLTSLIWNTRGERQCFQYSPRDAQKITKTLVRDPNAQISVISGAWAVPLFQQTRDFAEIRKEAARLQRIEGAFLDLLRAPETKAKVRIWKMADFLEAPTEPLQAIIDEIGQANPRRLTDLPEVVELTGFSQFLQKLKNQGMHPYLIGDFPLEVHEPTGDAPVRKPYMVRSQ